MKEFWTIRDIADDFGMEISNTRKFIAKNGIETYKRRTVETGNQLCTSLDRKGYEEFKALREGFLAVRPPVEVETGEGVFYFIQLVPEALPNRIKLGFTNDLAQRLQSHRCAAPTLKIARHVGDQTELGINGHCRDIEHPWNGTGRSGSFRLPGRGKGAGTGELLFLLSGTGDGGRGTGCFAGTSDGVT